MSQPEIIVGQRYACCPSQACVHYLAGKKSINRSGKCHSGLARQESSKITSLTVLPVLQSVNFFLLLLIISKGYSKLFESNNVRFSRTSYQIQSFINQKLSRNSILALARFGIIYKCMEMLDCIFTKITLIQMARL